MRHDASRKKAIAGAGASAMRDGKGWCSGIRTSTERKGALIYLVDYSLSLSLSLSSLSV
jgi:hypothetical protein